LDDISVSELGGQKTMSIAADGLNDWEALKHLGDILSVSKDKWFKLQANCSRLHEFVFGTALYITRPSSHVDD
jgi:hypothetical protein